MVSRLWDSAKKRVTDCAICGPMPWISLMSCSVAASSLSMLPKREARSWAARSPTIRMPRPFSRRDEPARLRAVDRRHQVARRLLGEPLELGERLGGERVEVGEVLHHAPVHELADHDLAEVLDVHGPPRAEVKEALLELGRAGGVGAAPDGFALGAEGVGAADRAHRRHAKRLGVGRALGEDDLDEIGDDVARALDQDRVADAHVLLPDLVLVVQAHVAHPDARPAPPARAGRRA